MGQNTDTNQENSSNLQTPRNIWLWFFILLVVTGIIGAISEFIAVFIGLGTLMSAGTSDTSLASTIGAIFLFFPFIGFLISSVILWKISAGNDRSKRIALSVILFLIPVVIATGLSLYFYTATKNAERKLEREQNNARSELRNTLQAEYEANKDKFQLWAPQLNNIKIEKNNQDNVSQVVSFTMSLPTLPVNGDYHVILEFIDSHGNVGHLTKFTGFPIYQYGSEYNVGTYRDGAFESESAAWEPNMSQVNDHTWQINAEPISSDGLVIYVNLTLLPVWEYEGSPIVNPEEIPRLYQKSFRIQ